MMPTKAFLHKKSLLDQFKDDYKSTGYIQSARAEHTWSNPITRRKRTNKLNGWIKSFQGKRHVHKLARFNAMQNENLEEAMSLKGFLSNIGDKLVNKYGLDKNKVQNYLSSHTQEMQELLDDKELSLKEKAEFVRSEITGEKDEAKQSESLVLPNPTIIYRGTSENAKKASHYISKILADKGLGWGRVGWSGPKNGEFHYGHPEKDVYTVCLRGSNDLIKDSFAVYKDVFGNDFWNNCDADPQGWVDPLTINRYDVATPRQESKKSEFYMDGDDSEDYYYCHRCGRVTPSYELDAHGGFCSDCDARWTAEHENESKDTDEKLGYEKGHKNSRGEDAPWVIRSHEDNRILASFAKKKDAEDHLKRMKQYSKQEAYVDNSATAQKDYVERVISAVQDYYGYSLFDAKNLVQRNAKKVKDWYMSGEVSDVEAARCLGGNCEPTKKSEAKEVTEDEGKEALRKLSKRGELPYGNNMRTDGLSLSRIADEIRYDVATALDMAAEACEDAMLDYGYDRIYVAIADGKTPEEVAADIKGSKQTESSDDDLRSRMKEIGYDLLENGNLHSWEYDFIKECLDFSEFKKLEQYLIRKGWYTIPTEAKQTEGIHLEFEDTIQVPEWLWKAYILDDTTDLEEDEIEKLNDFREKYKDYHLDDKSEDPYFSSRNDFDELGGNVYDVDAYKMSYKPTEKKSEAVVDVIESPGLRKVVKSWDWTCKKCGKPGARFADYDKDGNRIPGFLCKDCLQEMDGEKSEAVKDFPDGKRYKFNFNFYNPKTANIAEQAAKDKGMDCTKGQTIITIAVADPQDAIRFADAVVNLAQSDGENMTDRHDIDKAFNIAVKKDADYEANKDAIDAALTDYVVELTPSPRHNLLYVLGELTDVVDFLEAIK